MGEDAVVVFLPGAAGDITQVDNRSPYQIKQFGEVSARFVGGRVGAEAVKVLLAMEQGPDRSGRWPRRPRCSRSSGGRRSPNTWSKRLEMVQEGARRPVDVTEWIFAKEIVLLDARIAAEPVAEVEVQAVQVGPAVFLACPGGVLLPVRPGS